MAAAAPSPLASSAEKTNGAKLSRLLIDGGTTVLRNVFDTCHPPANLAADLNVQYKTLLSLSRRRILNKSQWDKLFPPSGAIPDSQSFDITLLFLLLTNICGLSPPSSGWHTKPSPSDTSLEANLARIKFFRNELYGHVTSTGVDTPTFNAQWQEISAVLVSLGLNQAEIDRLETERCGEDDYLDVLHDWADCEQDIKTQMKSIRLCQTETQQNVAIVLESQQEDHKTLQDTIFKLEGVCQSQSKTRQAVQEVHETLQAGFHEVNQKVEQLKKRREMERAEELLRNLAKSEFKGDIEYHAQRFQKGTREWIFKKVEDWLDDRSSPNRVMVISGSAGMGKSVISAVACKRIQGVGKLLGSHFCQHNNVRYRKPQLMLQSLACHLSQALPEYKNALVDQLSRNLGPVELNSMGAEELFALLFKEPLGKVADPGRNMLMVIDGLDESEYQGRNELLDVIANQFCKLPQWISFFVTTRPEINIADSLKHFQPIKLEENHDENLKDIQLFFEMQLSQEIEQEDKDRLLKSLVTKSEGIFLYAYFLTDFVKKNVSLLTQEQLECSLPLGISSVYLSHFKRLENELCKELRIEEDQMLRFLCAVSASREPLPVAFVSRLLDLSGRPLSLQRKLNKAIACISSLLPVRDDCLHFFHKSVKDWLTNTSFYGRHNFTVDEKEGHEILFELCKNELDKVKQKCVRDTQFNDTERYALQHGAQHMIEVGNSTEVTKTWHMEELVHIYVTDLELIYAKLCLGDTGGSDDLLNLTKQEYFKLLHSTIQCAVTTALSVSRKHKPVLRRQPQHFFQAILNEGGHEYATKALQILQNKYPEIPYIEILNKKDKSNSRRVQARFECDSLVACFDVSPQMDYMVCECVNKSIQLWSLGSGDRRWTRDALTVKPYGFPLNQNCALRDSGESFIYEEKRVWNPSLSSLSFYRSVVFHPGGEWVLPGSITDVFTINGDLVPLFPASNCSFTVCAFSGDKNKMLTDCPDKPENAVMWNMYDGTEIMHFQRKKNVSSFAFSFDGTLVAISDCSEHTGLYKVDNLNQEILCEIANPYISGLMHFSPTSQEIVCGYIDPEWRSEIEMTCFINNVPGPEEPVLNRKEPYLSWWPWEYKSLDEGRFLFQQADEEWGQSLSRIVPSFRSGFFSLISEESLLVGSPYSSEVCMVNLGRMKRFMRGGEDVEVFHDVKLSVDGKYRYVTRIVEYGWLITDLDPDSVSEGDNDYTSVTVEVYNEEDKIINSVSQFPDPLFLLPVRDGVFLLKRDNELVLWDSGLSRCERTFSEGNSVVKIFPVSEELVGRLTDRSKVDILRIANDEIEIAETTTVEDNVTSIICNDRFQFVACSIEKVSSDKKMKIVSIAVWTRQQRLWKRSIITENGINYPSAMIARNDDLVVVWKTFDQGNGVHVLDATTGLTLHKLLTDQIVSECEFLSDGKHFVCLSDDDTIIRRYNVFNTISGELISFIDSDAEYQPRGLTSCFYQPLFAVCLGLSPYQLFRVHLPELKGSERKEKRIKIQY